MVRLYFKHLLQDIKVALEYKSSFIFNFVSSLIVTFTYYFMIIALFDKFSNIAGFTKYEVLLCCAIIHFGFAINETFFRGIDKFDELIIDGALDRMLLRPQGVLFQVLASRTDLIKISRVLYAIAIMAIALVNLNIEWSFQKVILLLMMIIASIIIFFGLFVLMASYCFVTIQGLEVKNLMTDGGKFAAQYPIGIFKKGLKFVFTFIIPFAFVNYYPLLYFIGKENNILYFFSPLLVFIFLIPCLLSFKWGLKRYNSIGS